MTKKDFIALLNTKGYSFKEVDGIITINHGGGVYLRSLTSLPEGVEFNNGGDVHLPSLTSLPEGVEFNNGGGVYLDSLTSLPEGIAFNNGGGVYLHSLTSLPEGVEFNNGGYVDLDSLTSLPEGVEFNNGGAVYLDSLTSLPEGVEFNNGGYVNLDSFTNLPEGVEFNNGGYVNLKGKTEYISNPYIDRFGIEVKNGKVILYKKVSKDFLTQEGTENETKWDIGTTLSHPDWNPSKEECGAGKFHACARPHWCDVFRSQRGDRYVAVEVSVNHLYEWTDHPSFPQKIGFKEGKVLYEVDRNGERI